MEQADSSLILWVDKDLRVDDQYKRAADKLSEWQSAREGYLAGTMALGVLGVVLAVYLCCGAGHKPGTEEIYLNWFHRIPGDVLLFLLFWGAAGSTALGAAIVANAYGDLPMFMQLIGVGLGVAAAAAMGLAALVTVCARFKAHTLLRNTWTWAVCSWCWRTLWGLAGALGRCVQAVPLIWKAVMGCMGYTLFSIVTFAHSAGLWLIGTLAVSLYLCAWAYQWKKIRHGTQDHRRQPRLPHRHPSDAARPQGPRRRAE